MYNLERFTLVEMVEKSSKQYGRRPALTLVGGVNYSFLFITLLTRSKEMPSGITS